MKSAIFERGPIEQKEDSERENTPVEPLLHPGHPSNASSTSLPHDSTSLDIDNQMPSQPSPSEKNEKSSSGEQTATPTSPTREPIITT